MISGSDGEKYEEDSLLEVVYCLSSMYVTLHLHSTSMTSASVVTCNVYGFVDALSTECYKNEREPHKTSAGHQLKIPITEDSSS